MLKRLTLSLSLAFVLGTCGLSVAGGHGKSLPSAQEPIASAQCVTPSPQGCIEPCGTGCDLGCGKHFNFEMPDICGALKGCFGKLHDMCKPKPKCYTYEWVLKKKRVHHGLFGHKSCGTPSCDTCGTYPSAQGDWASGQALPAGQIAPAPAGQYVAPAGQIEAPATPPPAPGGTAQTGGLIYLPSGN
jgi:hypothetical protein